MNDVSLQKFENKIRTSEVANAILTHNKLPQNTTRARE